MDINAIGVPNLYACSVRINGKTSDGWSTTKIDTPTFYIGAASETEAQKKVSSMYKGLLTDSDFMLVSIGLVE